MSLLRAFDAFLQRIETADTVRHRRLEALSQEASRDDLHIEYPREEIGPQTDYAEQEHEYR